jgi:ferredoxin
MATMITSECINCGACEPECPNTAIYQGGVEWELDGAKRPALATDIFYIVPEKCTECVGFYDHEACAAVCPVDCCVPNPDIPESEAQLMARAKQLHPDQEFPADFPSRFKKEGAIAPAEAAASAAAAAPAGAPAASQAAPPPPAAAAPETETISSPAIPDIDDWEVPIECFRCHGSYAVAFKHFRSGVVFYCPYCSGSLVVTLTMHQHVAEALRRFHDEWIKEFETFQTRRRRELEEFEERQRQRLQAFNQSLSTLGREVRPPGAPRKRAWIFG